MITIICDDCKRPLKGENHIAIPRLEVFWNETNYTYGNLHFCDGHCFMKWFEDHVTVDGSWQE